jgi:membrane fusion protein, heavy metal efflux system
VLIQNQNAKEALAIPASAVVTDNGKDFVVVYRSRNDVTVKPINVIKTTNNITYIDGLQPGELVIAQNQLLLYNALAGK